MCKERHHVTCDTRGSPGCPWIASSELLSDWLDMGSSPAPFVSRLSHVSEFKRFGGEDSHMMDGHAIFSIAKLKRQMFEEREGRVEDVIIYVLSAEREADHRTRQSRF